MAEDKQDKTEYEVWLSIIKDSFAKQGYQKVSIDDLWDYCLHFLWKH